MAILEDSTQKAQLLTRQVTHAIPSSKHIIDAHKVCCYTSGMNILMLICTQQQDMFPSKTGTNEEIDSHIEVCYLLFCDIQAVLSHFCKDYDRIDLAFGCTVQ